MNITNKPMPTIVDIAKKAGVGISTVSRVLNNSGYASQETRKRVMQACKDLNYVANRMAGNLKGKATKVIALIIPDISSPFWSTVAKGVQDIISNSGNDLILSCTEGNLETELRTIQMVKERRVDGVICTTIHWHKTEFEELAEEIHTVMLTKTDMNVDMVYVDSFKGGLIGTEYLLRCNHTEVAFVGSCKLGKAFHERLQGYRSALELHGLKYDSTRVASGVGASNSSNIEIIKHLFDTDRPPTAIMAVDDATAMESWLLLEELGYSVPEDVSIMGFDDLPFSRHFRAGLSTVVQPIYERGKLAGSFLLERLNSTYTGEGRTKMLEPSLIIRNSIKNC